MFSSCLDQVHDHGGNYCLSVCRFMNAMSIMCRHILQNVASYVEVELYFSSYKILTKSNVFQFHYFIFPK
jgi:hypothetical protein